MARSGRLQERRGDVNKMVRVRLPDGPTRLNVLPRRPSKTDRFLAAHPWKALGVTALAFAAVLVLVSVITAHAPTIGGLVLTVLLILVAWVSGVLGARNRVDRASGS